jgi:hypothetical protein
MMSESAGKTAQHKQPQQAKSGADQPPKTAGSENPGESENLHVPGPSTEPFLVINVRKGATKEQIVKAVDKALETTDIPFFPYTTPARTKEIKAHARESESGTMPPCKALLMLVRQEGW